MAAVVIESGTVQTLDVREQARALMPALRARPGLEQTAIGTWRSRMINEYQSGRVFDALHLQLRAAGFAGDLADRCEAFAEEERMHGKLCGAVVEALGDEARALVSEPSPLPDHADVDRVEAVLRNLLSVCCLSETVAVSLVGAERLGMSPGPLRDLLTRIYADEIGHARFGWRLVDQHIPTLDARRRRRLSAYLAASFAHLERHELTFIPLGDPPPRDGAELGLCDGLESRRLFYDTVRDIIVPQLDALGLDATEAWRRRASV